jgi:hypothetical protein
MKVFCASMLGMAALIGAVHAADYGAWASANPGGTWTQAAEAAVSQSTLHQLVPVDAARYCPRYAHIDKSDRDRFWVALLSAMALPESKFDPGAQYVEREIHDASGKNVVSRGLLQISVESANQERYGCKIKQAEDLHDAATNLACAVKILNYWVAKDDSIGARRGAHRGGAQYWSVLRRGKHVSEIRRFTRKLDVCAHSRRPIQ